MEEIRMSEDAGENLTFPTITYGTHSTHWDFAALLHRGAASVDRRRVEMLLQLGQFGKRDQSRIPLVRSFHRTLSDELARGVPIATVETAMRCVWSFIRWADSTASPLDLDNVQSTFLAWSEYLVARVRIRKEVKEDNAHRDASRVAHLISRAIDSTGITTPQSLMRLTRLRRKAKRKHLGARGDRVNLQATFSFGNFLADICSGLGEAVVKGPLPVNIPLRDGKTIFISGYTRITSEQVSLAGRKRRKYERTREPLREHENPHDDAKRGRLLSLRVEAELLIFIAQTGMNLAQAFNLNREHYRWQKDEEDLLVYRVYKGRRSGEAIFRCFSAYRPHLNAYLSWLDQTGISGVTGKLFPFFRHGIVPPARKLPSFSAVKFAADQIGVERFGPRSLRKTRVNWLLRQSADLGIASEMAAHSKETLLRYYDEPHHQTASAEIVRFHAATDPTLDAPGPGSCASGGLAPVAIVTTPDEASKPDCVSAEGCLFCTYHRDVMTEEYCWKLTSHSRLKALEMALYKPPKKEATHPINLVIDRIEAKLHLIAAGSDLRSEWVRNARDKARSGRLHPIWRTQFELLNILV